MLIFVCKFGFWQVFLLQGPQILQKKRECGWFGKVEINHAIQILLALARHSKRILLLSEQVCFWCCLPYKCGEFKGWNRSLHPYKLSIWIVPAIALESIAPTVNSLSVNRTSWPQKKCAWMILIISKFTSTNYWISTTSTELKENSMIPSPSPHTPKR